MTIQGVPGAGGQVPPEELARRRASSDMLAAYAERGIDIVAAIPAEQMWRPTGIAWDWLWPRLLGRDHVRFLLASGQLLAVLTQPYDDLVLEVDKLTALAAAGIEVDVCRHCSPHYPGHTLAVFHALPGAHDRRPEDGLHLQH